MFFLVVHIIILNQRIIFSFFYEGTYSYVFYVVGWKLSIDSFLLKKLQTPTLIYHYMYFIAAYFSLNFTKIKCRREQNKYHPLPKKKKNQTNTTKTPKYILWIMCIILYKWSMFKGNISVINKNMYIYKIQIDKRIEFSYV